MERKLNKIQKQGTNPNSKKIYRKITKKSRYKNGKVHIRNKVGEIVTDEAEIKQTWKNILKNCLQVWKIAHLIKIQKWMKRMI